MITTEIKKQYNLIIESLVEARAESRTSSIFTELEAIPDKTADINAIFSKDPDLLQNPAYWIDILRLLRYSIEQKIELNTYYDSFIVGYQKLTEISNHDEDQAKLKEEIGTLMYSIDDATGNHERLAKKILQDISINMIRILHRVGTIENLHNSPIDSTIKPRLNELVTNLFKIIKNFRHQNEICFVLDRMNKLILQ